MTRSTIDRQQDRVRRRGPVRTAPGADKRDRLAPGPYQNSDLALYPEVPDRERAMAAREQAEQGDEEA